MKYVKGLRITVSHKNESNDYGGFIIPKSAPKR